MTEINLKRAQILNFISLFFVTADPRNAKQHHGKSKVKENHQLNPGGQVTDD